MLVIQQHSAVPRAISVLGAAFRRVGGGGGEGPGVEAKSNALHQPALCSLARGYRDDAAVAVVTPPRPSPGHLNETR